MMCRLSRLAVVGFLLLICLPAPLRAATWYPLGPFGGDARAFAADSRDPQHLYLGTATGWIYESHDGGNSWIRIAQIANRNDLVIDHILTDPVHPRRLIVGAWIVDREDGGLYTSDDAGKTWTAQAEMRGQSVRSLARSSSNPDELVAGTLRGVFRSMDNGVHWTQISPADSMEIHEVQSIAIDPGDPNIIYAGTWHLPWKTTDGGNTWQNIKEGIIEDSDVFSIIIDPTRPNIVYASACSGIYKSLDAGAQFTGGVGLNQAQGIPSTARRTRKLVEDPKNPDTVYGGTTEGLYRTLDGGVQWSRMTDADIIVNDVWVDPSNTDHVLIATDHGGVLASNDAGVSFHASNGGFSARQVSAYSADPDSPATLYVGVVNDKETGGVFQSTDGGLRWEQKSDGLNGRDVFSLLALPGGGLLAGTTHGIYRLTPGGWTQSTTQGEPTVVPRPVVEVKKAPVRGQHPAPHAAVRSHRPAPRASVVPPPEHTAPPGFDAQIFALADAHDAVFAATSVGLLRGDPAGEAWTPVPAMPLVQPRFLAAHEAVVFAADFKQLSLSEDHALTWKPLKLPDGLSQIGAVAVDNLNNLWVGGAEGAFLSSDDGTTWQPVPDLSVTEVDSIFFDDANQRVLITAANSTFVFAVHLPDYKVNYWAAGWKLRFARPVGDHLVGATLYDGVVIQPIMVDSSVGGYNASSGAQQASAERQ
jgi:photosystem II stability/assembly factor-like uncharacterized protein